MKRAKSKLIFSNMPIDAEVEDRKLEGEFPIRDSDYKVRFYYKNTFTEIWIVNPHGIEGLFDVTSVDYRASNAKSEIIKGAESALIKLGSYNPEK